MATGSKRELILETVESSLQSISWVQTVQRQKLTPEELKNFATTQLPLLGVMGKLPNPKEKFRSNRGPSDGFISDLGIDIICYGNDNVSPDTTISNYLDDLWANLFSITFPKRCKVSGVNVSPNTRLSIWKPYFVFGINYVVTYAHDKGGI